MIAGAVTALLLGAFIGVTVWAYGPARRSRFDAAARLPFADEEGTP